MWLALVLPGAGQVYNRKYWKLPIIYGGFAGCIYAMTCKNRYRRWRDLSVFATIAVYALSVIDAYVDASLSEFDISEDLSLRVAPVVMGNDGAMTTRRSPFGQNAIGLGCSLRF